MKRLVIVHCSATRASMDIGVEEIRRWHVEENGWRDIGYNYVIRRDGSIEPGRDLDGDGDVMEETGAHARGFNTESIGVCLVGGTSDSGPEPFFNFTMIQLVSLEALISDIRTFHPGVEVVGHRDLDSRKECPCFDVKAMFNRDRI